MFRGLFLSSAPQKISNFDFTNLCASNEIRTLAIFSQYTIITASLRETMDNWLILKIVKTREFTQFTFLKLIPPFWLTIFKQKSISIDPKFQQKMKIRIITIFKWYLVELQRHEQYKLWIQRFSNFNSTILKLNTSE